ncbi:unnamed protein product [Penicillium salamii]|uniref:Zn(2)-C6 fungal-type domain-containing protein n=1 Tax=Penicillium salamii TaxID=1612424 RepID=A0A9W4ILM4_9EURO|nr:unnamed protein product [Penicillium salamii]CAG7989457.1 unnamed protein product [Penicillium salamii]CAG8305438.1 unnamed protein product [Penicillium salamii]CAG8607152.1 unnamed protein product [Penicillium salamii]CAG8890937.1 unnamed protein product [Penicillium salamii]
MSLRSCRPCHTSKIRCTREVPHCQTCIKRGKGSFCVYETRVSGRKLAPPEPQPKRQKPKQEGESGEYHIRRRAFEPQPEASLQYETSTNENMQHAIGPTKEADNKGSDQGYSGKGDLAPHEMPPKSIATKIADKASILQPEYGRAAVGDILEWSRSISVSQPAQLYAHMTPPTSLPPRPNFNLTISGRHNCGPHTTHQLLLVLSYLFISSMLPMDLGALWKVICRRDRDWEESFVLQHGQLQRWLISARNVLTKSDGLHTATLADIELQTRYILFIIGQYTSPHSSSLAESFQSAHPPYRPFGARASIALICLVFEGIRVDEMEGYESKEIWTRDKTFLIMMASRLKESPLFGPEVSILQLQSMISSLQKAFQCEEIRGSSTKFRTLRIESQLEVLGYYRQAFLAFDPILLPKILASLSKAEDITYSTGQSQLTNMERCLDRRKLTDLQADPAFNTSTVNLALRLANIFTSLALDRLDAAFQTICEIQQSKADKVVAMEMMHVKSFEEVYKLNRIAHHYSCFSCFTLKLRAVIGNPIYLF